MITLGPFELELVLGEGAMGRVWGATDHRDGRPVAIKVLRFGQGGSSQSTNALFNEVRAVAGLDHPHVVHVIDHGVVGRDQATASSGRLAEAAPWLAMELASGSLEERLGSFQSWGELRTLLLALLDALAHAHARGVIHRDIKPANVLMGRLGPLLSDFGLAQVASRTVREGDLEATAGTPAYMSPEQIEGRWRDHGPWTDLYAMGCLAWELTSGRPPFHQGEPRVILQKHLRASPPRFKPRLPVPRGLDVWLHHLLEKRTARRFRSAAHAAWELAKLGEPEGQAPAPLVGLTFERELEILDSSGLRFADDEVDDELTDPHGPPVFHPWALTFLEDEAHGALPVPSDWRQRELRPRPESLALFGLRPLPVVGREEERDALWDCFRLVRRQQRSGMVILRGPAGAGKSRLAEWLAVRTRELGAAEVLRVVHHPSTTEVDGVAPAVNRHLGCEGMDAKAAARRIQASLGQRGVVTRHEVAALAELLAPEVIERRLDDLEARPHERFGGLTRLITAIGSVQPVILWLDDLQWGADTLRFCQELLARQRWRPAPLLLVATLRDDALLDRSEESELVQRLLRRPEVVALPVGPLRAGQREDLVKGLLHVDAGLARRLSDRTRGMPLFAVQLLGDLVARGALSRSPGGWKLAEGERIVMPLELSEVWEARLDRLLEGRPRSDAMALEIAAVLGGEVDGAEWRDASGAAGLAPSVDLVSALLSERLASCPASGPERGWQFVHELLREALLSRCRTAGRWAAAHCAVADMLATRRGNTLAERRGRHLLEAGRPEEALEPLLVAAQLRLTALDHLGALTLFHLREAAMHALPVPSPDPRWVAGWRLRALAEGWFLHPEQGIHWARRALERCERFSWDGDTIRCLLLIGRFYRVEGRIEAAYSHLRKARDLALRGGWADHQARIAVELAHLARWSGEFERARALYVRALEGLEATGDPVEAGLCELAVVECDIRLGVLDEGVGRRLLSARWRFEAAGDQRGLVRCQEFLGDYMRARGELSQAEKEYRDGLLRHESLGRGPDSEAHLKLGHVLVLLGRHREARRVLDTFRIAVRRMGRKAPLASALAGLLPCLAREGDWETFDGHLGTLRSVLESTGYVDADLATMLELAADEAKAAGREWPAQRARTVARAQRAALQAGDDDELADDPLTVG